MPTPPKHLPRIGRLSVLLVAAVLLVSGCAARNHLRQADAAAAAGDMRSALYHYERALSHDADLAQDTEYLDRLAAAQTRVAYEDAAVLRADGRFEAAARKLHESLSYDPGFVPSAELLAVVNREAGQERYRRALAAADLGAMDAAGEHLRIAFAHDPVNDAVLAALASLQVETLPANTAGLDAFRRGASQAGELRWSQAAGAYREAITLNPNLLPARAELATAQAQLAESRQLADSGAARVRESRISVAVPLLEQALEVWPYNQPARELLTHAQSALALANSSFNDAVGAAEQSDWDAAIAAADAGLVVDKSHPQLRELRPQLSTRAANDYTRRAAAHLEVEDYEGARDDYLRALDYKHPHAPAQRGLAGVYYAMGERLEQQGRPGAALLHYHRGQTYMATAEISQGQTRAYRAVRQRNGMTLGIAVGETPEGLAVSSGRLSDALHRAAARHERSGLALTQDEPRFALTTEVTGAWIEENRTGATTRTHNYTVDEPRPNPRYHALVDDIDDLRIEIDRLEADYHSHVGRNHGHHRHDGGDVVGDRHGHGREISDREARHLNQLLSRINRSKRDMDRLYAQLRRTPREVLVAIPYTANYTIETYTKTGGVTVDARLIDTQTGETIESFTVSGEATHRDTTVPNPRPEIGIQSDPLSLPDDGQVAHEVAADAARSATSRAIEAAVMYELDKLRASAAAMREAADETAALEAEVAAGVLVEMVDSDASSRVLGNLGEAHVE